MPSNSNTVFNFNFFFSFHWENGSMINSFHIVAPNSLEPSRCTLTTHWELSEGTKSVAWSALLWEIFVWQTKQNKTNYLISLIDVRPNKIEFFIIFFLNFHFFILRVKIVWFLVEKEKKKKSFCKLATQENRISKVLE